MTGLWQEIQPYLDPETGLLMAPDGGKDNLVLFSAYLIRELYRTGDTGNAFEMVRRTSAFLMKCEVGPGLYFRHPSDPSGNSVDNMIGTCFVSMLDASFILERWNRLWGCFDVHRPAWVGIGANWYGRFVGLKPYIKAAAGQPVSWLDKVIWSAACIWSTIHSTGASDPLLQSLQNDTMPGCQFAKRIWDKKYSVPALYAEYFGEGHPLAKY